MIAIRPFLLSATLLLASSPIGATAPVPTSADRHGGVDWVRPQGADMAPIFAQARAAHKPVFLYWGAVWCPPCNQVKATVFNRPDFIERSRWFIPVYLDGDTPGAQKLGAQFKVRGYPTMILLNADGQEITRLPGEVDARTYLEVLSLGLASAGGVKEAMARALQAGGSKATNADWRLLAYYAWEQDEGQLVAKTESVAVLRKLAMACPASAAPAAARLLLKSVVAARLESQPVSEPEASLAQVQKILANASLSTANADVLINYSTELLGALTPPDSAQRKALGQSMDKLLRQLAANPRLSKMDRLGAVQAQLALAKQAQAPQAELQGGPWRPDAHLLERVHQAVRAATTGVLTPYERQALIPAAADLLSDAGLRDESDALLKAELERAVSPYYHMLILAANARARGDTAQALVWSEKAWTAAQGSATRLQWGVGFVSRLVDLAPGEVSRIEAAAAAVLGEVEPVSESFYERNRRGLERLGKKLSSWAEPGERGAALERLQAQWQGTCTKLAAQDDARRACDAVLARH